MKQSRIKMFLPLFTFLLILHSNFLGASTTNVTSIATAVSKQEESCTMCDGCENPCPVPSPPPPPTVVECPPPPPPPSPPPPALPECPPPPMPPCPNGCYLSPSPPSGFGEPSSSSNPPGPFPPKTPLQFPQAPPGGIVPYFPYYYYNPPSAIASNSFHLNITPFVSSIIVLLTSLCLF